jgi:hypothetical protein
MADLNSNPAQVRSSRDNRSAPGSVANRFEQDPLTTRRRHALLEQRDVPVNPFRESTVEVVPAGCPPIVGSLPMIHVPGDQRHPRTPLHAPPHVPLHPTGELEATQSQGRRARPPWMDSTPRRRGTRAKGRRRTAEARLPGLRRGQRPVRQADDVKTQRRAAGDGQGRRTPTSRGRTSVFVSPFGRSDGPTGSTRGRRKPSRRPARHRPDVTGGHERSTNERAYLCGRISWCGGCGGCRLASAPRRARRARGRRCR